MFLRRHNTSLLVRTPAKLNLFLEVLGKRTDGYHDLESLMVKVNIFDHLTLTPADSLSLTADLSSLPVDSRIPLEEFASHDNLILRAARLLQQHTGISRGAAIHIRKHIPLQSGLAGGSTDAAATLVALNQLWELGVSHAELQHLSAQLGSDIPFFFCPAPGAVCSGRGEIVRPLPPGPELAFVIARPESGLSTPLVFKHLSLQEASVSIEPVCDAWQARRRSCLASRLFNRLQAPAESLNPDVVHLKHLFQRLPFLSHQMSGSGTSYFGICRNLHHARRLASQIRTRGMKTVFVAACPA